MQAVIDCQEQSSKWQQGPQTVQPLAKQTPALQQQFRVSGICTPGIKIS